MMGIDEIFDMGSGALGWMDGGQTVTGPDNPLVNTQPNTRLFALVIAAVLFILLVQEFG